MHTLWIHSAMEQLQHLIQRRACHNNVPRAEVIRSWRKIQQDVRVAIIEMDKEYEAKLVTNALSNQEAAWHKSVLRKSGRWPTSF